METLSALLALCEGNSPVTGEFPSQRPVTRNFNVFFDLRLNKRLSKQSICRWFETSSRPSLRQYNVYRNILPLLSVIFMFLHHTYACAVMLGSICSPAWHSHTDGWLLIVGWGASPKNSFFTKCSKVININKHSWKSRYGLRKKAKKTTGKNRTESCYIISQEIQNSIITWLISPKHS